MSHSVWPPHQGKALTWDRKGVTQVPPPGHPIPPTADAGSRRFLLNRDPAAHRRPGPPHGRVEAEQGCKPSQRREPTGRPHRPPGGGPAAGYSSAAPEWAPGPKRPWGQRGAALSPAGQASSVLGVTTGCSPESRLGKDSMVCGEQGRPAGQCPPAWTQTAATRYWDMVAVPGK